MIRTKKAQLASSIKIWFIQLVHSKKHTIIVSLYNCEYRETFQYTTSIERLKHVVCYCCCRLLFPLALPPPRLCLLCAFFLCLLASELLSFAAFLSTCLLPLDLPTTVNVYRKIIYKHITYNTLAEYSQSFGRTKEKGHSFNLLMF